MLHREIYSIFEFYKSLDIEDMVDRVREYLIGYVFCNVVRLADLISYVYCKGFRILLYFK